MLNSRQTYLVHSARLFLGVVMVLVSFMSVYTIDLAQAQDPKPAFPRSRAVAVLEALENHVLQTRLQASQTSFAKVPFTQIDPTSVNRVVSDTRIYIPNVYRPVPEISGLILVNGMVTAGVVVELRLSPLGEPATTISSTVTDATGRYRFVDPPKLPRIPVLHRYSVRYLNPGTAANEGNGRLGLYVTASINLLDNSVELSPADLADIPFGSPYDPQFVVSISTPRAFSWTRRVFATDDYRLVFTGVQNDTAYFQTPALGYASSYLLNSRPAGFASNKEYHWNVLAYTAEGGFAANYDFGAVSFDN